MSLFTGLNDLHGWRDVTEGWEPCLKMKRKEELGNQGLPKVGIIFYINCKALKYFGLSEIIIF